MNKNLHSYLLLQTAEENNMILFSLGVIMITMGGVVGQQILQPFHVIDERINDITVWSSLREKEMAVTAVGNLGEDRIPTIQFLTFCHFTGIIFSDGTFSFPALKDNSQFRAMSSVNGYVLLGTDRSQIVPAGKTVGAVISLEESKNVPITAITSFISNDRKPSFLIVTWENPWKLTRFDVNTKGLVEGPKVELSIGRIRSGVSTQNFSYFVSDTVPSKLVTIYHGDELVETQTITLPCGSIRNGYIVRNNLSFDYEFSFWATHTSPISICKLKHNKVEGVAKFVSSFQINGTDDLAATSIIANIDGHIIIGTKSYSKSSPATVFLLKDNGDDITLENSWKFDESSDTINCIRFDENIAYFVNRNSPAEIMSINVTKENSYEQIYHGFSNNSTSHCRIVIYGGPSKMLAIGAPLVLEIQNTRINVTNSSEVQWLQIGLSVESDELSSLELFFEIVEEAKKHFFPIFLGISSSSTLLHAKFSSASHQGLANFVASRVVMRDIKSFKLVVRNTKKFVADERTVKHFSVQTCTS